MQTSVFIVVCGVHIGALIFPLVQLGTCPLQDNLNALCPPLLILVGPVQAWLQCPLGHEDLRAHTQQVQYILIVNVAFIGVTVFAEEKGSGGGTGGTRV